MNENTDEHLIKKPDEYMIYINGYKGIEIDRFALAAFTQYILDVKETGDSVIVKLNDNTYVLDAVKIV